jgi:hypothetical protein
MRKLEMITITREILLDSANKYDKSKYPEEFYNYHLEILKNSKAVEKQTAQAVEYLFLWKLGKVSTRYASNCYSLDFTDSTGQKYYAIPTTDANSEAIKKQKKKID